MALGGAAQFLEQFFAPLLRSLHLFLLLLLLCHSPSSSPSRASAHHSVEDVFSREEVGAVGEDDVVFGEAFLE